MNMHVEKALDDLGKVDAMMYAIENSYLSIEVIPTERERAERAESAFYVLWDLIRAVKEDVTNVQGDQFVVEAINRSRMI